MLTYRQLNSTTGLDQTNYPRWQIRSSWNSWREWIIEIWWNLSKIARSRSDIARDHEISTDLSRILDGNRRRFDLKWRIGRILGTFWQYHEFWVKGQLNWFELSFEGVDSQVWLSQFLILCLARVIYSHISKFWLHRFD